MIWKLCLLCAAAALGGVQAGPIRKTEGRKAQLEEVNVLMYGVIQLSESLNYAHKTTETKIARISQTLKSHEGTLHNLEEKAEKAVDVEKQMRAVIGLLQEQMTEHEAQTKMSKELLTTVEKEEVGMNTKVKKLEMDLDNYVPLNLRELQERAKEHTFVLRNLKELTKYQREIIEAQDEQISNLQNMTEDMFPSL